MNAEIAVVYVVDDEPSVRKSLERLLRSAGYDVRTFTSALEFVDAQHSSAPGCLILDVKMPRLSGLELQERLVEEGVTFPIIFITAHGTVPMTVQAMKAGAVDFLQKPVMDEELLKTVSRAIAKDCQIKRHQGEFKKLRDRMKTLTPREREVFRLVAEGMLNKQIAFDLGTKESTIKVHRARVFQKMGAESLADLVRIAEKLHIRFSNT